MEIKDSVFVKIKDRRIPLESIKGYYPINTQKAGSDENIYSICLEISGGSLVVNFPTKKERDYTVSNLDKIFSVQYT